MPKAPALARYGLVIGVLWVAVFLISRVRSGPIPPFAALSGLRLEKMDIGPQWVRGCYAVTWTYKGRVNLDALDSELRTEAVWTSGYSYVRVAGQVRQKVTIGVKESMETKPGGLQYPPVVSGTVRVTETPLLYGPLPDSWPKDAIAKKPKEPLQPSPIDGRALPVEVVRQDYDGAILYTYLLPGSLKEGVARAKSVLLPRGYKAEVYPGRLKGVAFWGPNGDRLGVEAEQVDDSLEGDDRGSPQILLSWLWPRR